MANGKWNSAICRLPFGFPQNGVFPLPRGEGGPRPAFSSAGAGRVRGFSRCPERPADFKNGGHRYPSSHQFAAWLPNPQFIYFLKRCPTFAAYHRAAVSAYERLRNILAASGTIERLAFLVFVFAHLFVSRLSVVPNPSLSIRSRSRGRGTSL
jgi:hypothetical protein